MDADAVALVNRLIADRIALMRSALERASGGRGRQLVEFIEEYLRASESEASRLSTVIAGSGSDRERVIHGRRLLRIKQIVDAAHALVFEYSSDVGRRDLPVGLLHLIDALIDGLLKTPTDPVVHLDRDFMYSTEPVVAQWESILTELRTTFVGPAEPVIFNLPGLDPANVLLSPILAHEVGHVVQWKTTLAKLVLGKVDTAALDQLFQDQLAAAVNPDPYDWQLRFRFWLEELICDALATALSGPSMLFASAAFLPAPAGGTLKSHPFPADRLRLTVEHLKADGWSDLLAAQAPDIVAWTDAIVAGSPIGSDPKEVFLRNAVDLVGPALIEVANDHAGERLDVDRFMEVQDELSALLDAEVPPAQPRARPVSPWEILLASWLNAISRGGATPESLGSAVADADFNAFVLKSIEMVRVQQLWDEP